MWVVNDQALPYVALAMVAYAALIASFLGGLHWGVVWLRHAGVPGMAELPEQTARQHLVWGIVPTILAWPGVLMPAYAALPWLGMLLVACYLVAVSYTHLDVYKRQACATRGSMASTTCPHSRPG